ncbi:monofunctional lysine-ketoglutarate reductase 1 [Gossypium australe]|uniref:Monofunctional lysine-ketoglutarate reductase 1 n=1 Tax=Gossypium australe TaxID=47621 RepID=A0A5B6W7A2_9ROSI|nr:monofunctional lysine-ketoglutarate reductase 1 [Gossypium australe]
MLGNGVLGILSESKNKWERTVPLTPSQCARLPHNWRENASVTHIIVQPSTKRIYHDSHYEDVGCHILDDLSECSPILGIITVPYFLLYILQSLIADTTTQVFLNNWLALSQLDMVLPTRALKPSSYMDNMPLLDKEKKVSLYDYEIIVGDHGKRLLAFSKYAGRAGMIDFLPGLGHLGYSTPFLSLGASYMYPSLAAVITMPEEIASQGLPSRICPVVFEFTDSGNVSIGAQQIFKLLPHAFIEPSKLPQLFGKISRLLCTPEHYNPIFHEKIAPYASVIGSTKQIQELNKKTCDIGGPIEFAVKFHQIFVLFGYDSLTHSYRNDIDGNGIICAAVHILPTEFAKDVQLIFPLHGVSIELMFINMPFLAQHFGDILQQTPQRFLHTLRELA